MPLKSLLAGQSKWAARRWPTHPSGRAPSIKANLFHPLCDATFSDISGGSGDELGIRSGKPKMDSLRSSTALACNVFDPWRGRDLAPLGLALGLEGIFLDIAFERKCRHGLRGTPPNLDVFLIPREGTPVGIESKFCEIYGAKKPHPSVDPKYFAGGRKRWEECQLPKCEEFARSLGSDSGFRRLGAGQLLKHILGLAFTHRHPVHLVYLWYDDGSHEADEHRQELQEFSARIDSSIDLIAKSYQGFFTALQREPEPVPGYHDYLRERYFTP